MRILLVTMGYRGYSQYYSDALGQLGHDVTTYVGMKQWDLETRIRRVLEVRIPNAVGARRHYLWSEQRRFQRYLHRNRGPFDLYLFVNAHSLVTDATMTDISATGRPSGLWLLDDLQLTQTDDLAITSFDHFATFGRLEAEQLSEQTGRPWLYVPQGFAPIEQMNAAGTSERVIVLGSPTGRRQAAASALIAGDIDVHLIGRTWSDFHSPSDRVLMTRDVPLPESLTLSANACVCVNAHRSVHTGVSPRVFEIGASGGLIITDNMYADEFFDIGSEALHWVDSDTAVDHAQRALRDRAAAARIAERGQRRVQLEHTLDRRFAALLTGWGLS
jgi:hypothetical protein